MERRLFKAAFFIFLFMFLVEQGVHVFLEKEKELFIWTAPNVSDMIRTRDLLIRSQTLYPAELHSHDTARDIIQQFQWIVKKKIQILDFSKKFWIPSQRKVSVLQNLSCEEIGEQFWSGFVFGQGGA